jgi:TRAP-type mannitol/chloroaromatic compound transport system permease large subunit
MCAALIPFILLQLIAVALVFYFPTISTSLPKAIGW